MKYPRELIALQLIELFVAALGKQTEQQQKRKQGVRAT
jgi:hypothetical protein